MKQADYFGHDYTLYISQKDEAENESKKASKKAKKSKKGIGTCR
ncbi:MAG TPA: hypothetical protein VIK55_19150 [Paludibacter sp.]